MIDFMPSNKRARALACTTRRLNPVTRLMYPCSQVRLDSTMAGEHMPAGKRCVVVADRKSARILLAQVRQGSTMELTEHSEIANCGRRQPCLDRQFVDALAHHVSSIVQHWQDGSVVIAATPEMLGQLRGVVQDALPRGIVLKALAKDYFSLSAPELAERLNF
jgi:protein required for attachment to host cells